MKKVFSPGGRATAHASAVASRASNVCMLRRLEHKVTMFTALFRESCRALAQRSIPAHMINASHPKKRHISRSNKHRYLKHIEIGTILKTYSLFTVNQIRECASDLQVVQYSQPTRLCFKVQSVDSRKSDLLTL
ncbi:jg15245 [Pararge aegeria aegeria]|uniref:Jg15245 protein n=1 Tax=Pararge aegeria aegeria TaxID=348720 RepID=A0A8S4QDA6_9NEOP|nr:jg15245 [Pararge aegeria aegeria]